MSVIEEPEPTASEILRIPIIEEVAEVNIQEAITGRVRVRTVTEGEDVSVERDLYRSDVEVERVLINRWIEDGADIPETRTEGNVTIVPLIEEVLVVEKRMRLTEEVRITFKETTDITHIPVQLRRQRAVIERAGPDGVFIPQDPAPTPDPKD